jgi:hypothetical protein
MARVIDANVLKEYYQVTVLDMPATLTGNAQDAFDRTEPIIIDEGDQIANEWKSLVCRDWFDTWFARMLTGNRIAMVTAKSCPNLATLLTRHGFPRQSRDIWYVRTAKSFLANNKNCCFIVTEDLDFFDPTKKGVSGTARISIMQNPRSPMRLALKNSESIDVLSLGDFNAQNDG